MKLRIFINSEVSEFFLCLFKHFLPRTCIIQNTVTSYSFTKSDIIGAVDEPDADYDLITVIMIRRGNDEGKADIFNYLSGVFNRDKKKVSHYVDVDRNEKIQEVFQRMSGLGNSIYEKGQQQGMQQGMLQGQAEMMSVMQKLFAAGRIEDAKRATTDMAYFNQIKKEFAQ